MINENIKNARKAKGISQEEMAVKLNVVRQTVSKWERGLSVPDADVLIKIADLLETSVNDLLGTKLQSETVEDLTNELARLNEKLAVKVQDENLYLQAEKKRGMILLFCFTSMLISMSIKNELISIILTGGWCVLAALVILYRNLALLTKATTVDMKIGTLKVTNIFNIAILVINIFIITSDRTAIIRMSESDEKLFALIIISIIILFGGFISPKLPFSRHTGLRLPWTVQDEDTWNVAHKIMGYISLPLVLLYLAGVCTIRNFEAITVAIMLLWVGIPGFVSFAFWWKKYHSK